MKQLTHFSLFTGIGGLDLAGEWAGFETVGQCEWADYPTKVLEKHWPDVARWRDIRSVTRESFEERTGLSAIDVISGGFPCQPFSIAGKRRGKEDDRYLWPEMLRVISEIKPTWVLGENVAGIVNMALDQVLSDLEHQGYEVQAFIIPAAGVGALHRRKRVFILGYSKHNGQLAKPQLRSHETTGDKWRQEEQTKARELERANRPADVPSVCRSKNGSEQILANTNSKPGLQTNKTTCSVGSKRNSRYNACWSSWRFKTGTDWWGLEPNVGRVANGISERVDRLKCLGNAVVPQQAYPIFQAIADIENHKIT